MQGAQLYVYGASDSGSVYESLKGPVCGVCSYDSYLKKDHPSGKTLHGTGKPTSGIVDLRDSSRLALVRRSDSYLKE